MVREGDTPGMSATPAEDALVRLCRAAVGDVLRSIVYVTPRSTELRYVRRDLRGPGYRGRELERALWIDERTVDREIADRFVVRRREGVTVACIGVDDREVRLTSDDPRGGECEFENVAPSVTTLLEIKAGQEEDEEGTVSASP